jgi:acyl-CoA synthetase (NDP forming)
MLRVGTMAELFDAVETLALTRAQQGDRLAVLTYGDGPGVLATDALVARGGRVATLSADTVAQLDGALPRTWNRGNERPVAEARRLLVAARIPTYDTPDSPVRGFCTACSTAATKNCRWRRCARPADFAGYRSPAQPYHQLVERRANLARCGLG